ncbi:uncharacterized protein METZ01_LOCUS13864 [marine metagenome]|uniref:Uncharacterized protein n=1 Tax=marine metagenome TaxID=408172 RepID=A0A381P2C1_9ZZZZ
MARLACGSDDCSPNTDESFYLCRYVVNEQIEMDPMFRCLSLRNLLKRQVVDRTLYI